MGDSGDTYGYGRWRLPSAIYFYYIKKIVRYLFLFFYLKISFRPAVAARALAAKSTI
jgi:hypothetical protein